MAPPATEPAEGRMAELLLRLLGPRPGRLEFAARVALICALTALVAEVYQTPRAALTVYVVLFFNRPDRVESLILTVALTVLTTLILTLTLLVTMIVLDVAFWRVIAMAVISFCFLFMVSASKLRPIAGILALICGYALGLLGTFHMGEFATRALLYAWLLVGIPAGVSIVVNLLLAPAPRRLAEQAIAERLRVAAAFLREPGAGIRRDFVECLREGAGEISTRLKLAAVEKTSPPQDIAALRQAAESSAALLSWIDATDRVPDARLPDPMRVRLAQTLEDMAGILVEGTYPVEIRLEEPAPAAALPPLPARAWAAMQDLIQHFAEPRVTAQQVHESPRSAPPSGGFLVPDAFTNPAHVRYALKATAAAMFCYILYSLLDWPGIHTCFITCYIVALTTTAETVEKLTLRIAGCLLGGAAGIAAIVFVMPSLTSIVGLLAVVFVGALASAWIVAGSPRVSYAGFQVAFAFFLCVIQGPAPVFELEIARDRIIGILIGNLVVYLLFTTVWPVSVADRVDAAIGALLRRLSTLTKAPAASRAFLAADAQAALGAIERDLEIAAYEPVSIRPAEGWLQTRHRTTAALDAIEGSLLLIADADPLTQDVARRFERLADDLSAEALSAPDASSPAEQPGRQNRHPTDALSTVIESRLRDLDDALLPQMSPERIASHAPA